MTKKDFQLIAQGILNMPERGSKQSAASYQQQVAEYFASVLAATNPLFKRELFIQAATGVVAVTARKAISVEDR